jgi:CRP-like cAMP-binding protein
MQNHILSSLTPEDCALLLMDLEEVELSIRQELEHPEREIEHVYFLEAGIAAVLLISGKDRLALGLIGCEGASGIAVFLGNSQSPHCTTMLTAGRAFRISTAALYSAMEKQPELKRLLLRYSLAFYNQAAHTALSNAYTTVGQRVARWVLMTHDRYVGDVIPLTHDTIAYMLGARRAGVTKALDALQVENLIAVSRGSIEILDRKAIEAVAGHHYGIPEKEFVRLVGTFWPPILPERMGQG